MLIDNCLQNSEEWFKARAGIPTASCFDKILTPVTLKPSKSSTNYMYQLAGERLAGCKTETYSNAIMQRGIELEAEARELFEMVYDVEVEQVGLVYHDNKKLYSCSPDGLIKDSGLEIKCPLIHTHVSYLLEKKLPDEYILQVQGGMMITGFDKWHFMSYYPGLPPLIIEVQADKKIIDAIKSKLKDFCGKLDIVTDKLKKFN